MAFILKPGVWTFTENILETFCHNFCVSNLLTSQSFKKCAQPLLCLFSLISLTYVSLSAITLTDSQSSTPIVLSIVYYRRSHIIPVFFFGQIRIWRHDISRSNHSWPCLHAALAKQSVCLHVSRAVSRLWPSDVRCSNEQWTLIGQ